MLSQTIIATTEDGETLISPTDNTAMGSPFDSKESMELNHAQHFEALVKEQHPKYGLSLIERGSEPPDFLIRRGNKVSGLELTLYTPSQRREQIIFFAKTQKNIGELIQSENITGLSGLHIELSFGELGGEPKHIPNSTLQELMGIFIKLANHPREEIPTTDLLSHPPLLLGQEGYVGDGAVHWHVSAVSNVPRRGSELANVTGFELTHTYRDWVSMDEIKAVLQTRIDAKDKPGADELLISGGAPDRKGWQIFAETDCLLFYMQKWQGLTTPPKYLKRIFLDIWGIDRTFVLYSEDK